MSKRRKNNHGRAPQAKIRLDAGESRVTHVAAKNGAYARVTVEYRSHAADEPGLAQTITDAMHGAARNTDLRALAEQVPELIVEGEILVPDGTHVVEKWIPAEHELLVLKARPAKMEDLAELPIYGEAPGDTDSRKAKARRLLAVAHTQGGMNASDFAREDL